VPPKKSFKKVSKVRVKAHNKLTNNYINRKRKEGIVRRNIRRINISK
jgi:hypothetical protein